MYQTVAEKANELRSALKQAGFNRNMVSVRSHHCGWDDAIDIVINSPVVKSSKVSEIANKYQEIRWDEYCGEILQGCNTFVDIRYSQDVRNKWIEIGTELAESIFPYGEYIPNEIPNFSRNFLHEIDKNGNSVLLFGFNSWENRWEVLAKSGNISSTRIVCFQIQDLALAIGMFESIGEVGKY